MVGPWWVLGYELGDRFKSPLGHFVFIVSPTYPTVVMKIQEGKKNITNAFILPRIK